MLEVVGLTSQRNHRFLFQELGFSLTHGQGLLLQGQNGSGKSTLLRILSGLYDPDAGQVTWSGTSIQENLQDYHQQLAYLGHQDGLKHDLTGRENLVFSCALNKTSYSQTEKWIDLFEMQTILDRPVRHLSAGQKRKLALIRILSTQRRLWLLDEPFTSLDVQSCTRLEASLHAHLAQGGMFILTSHQEFLQAGGCIVEMQLSIA